MKPVLEVIEEDNNHTILHLYQDISELDLYQKNTTIDRFMKNESKKMENALDKVLRRVLHGLGINYLSNDESVLKSVFATLKGKGMTLIVVDRYKNIKDEQVLGISDNHMTVIIDRYDVLSIAMEVRLERL